MKKEIKIGYEIGTGKKVLTYWACIDGCYNMEDILLGKLNFYNQTQKGYYDKCAEVCSKQYFIK